MSVERHPELERLFAEASRDLADEAFIAGVMAAAARRRKQRRIVMLAAGLVAIAAIWLVSAPLDGLIQRLADLMWRPLTDVDGGFVAPILGPVNTVAGALVLALVALRVVLRKLFG